MKYTHLIFDLDGTLVDSRADLAAAANYVLRTLGLAQLPLQVVAGYIGEGARRLIQQALGSAQRERLDDALATFLDYYGAHLLDETRAYPGIAELLAALVARGVTLSVLTNKPERMSRQILAGLGLLAHFAEVLGGDSLATRKPDPAGIEYLQRRTATPRERMLLVGDSAIDVQTARAAGIAFCGVAWGLAPARLRDADPERIIEDPVELVRVAAGDED